MRRSHVIIGHLSKILTHKEIFYLDLWDKYDYSSDPNKRGAPNKRGDGKFSIKIGIKNIQKGYFTTFFGQMRLENTNLVHFIIISV